MKQAPFFPPLQRYMTSTEKNCATSCLFDEPTPNIRTTVVDGIQMCIFFLQIGQCETLTVAHSHVTKI